MRSTESYPSKEPHRAGRMRRFRSIAAAAAAMVLAASFPACKRQQAAAAGPQQGPPPEVAVVTVQPEPVTITTELPGRTSAYLMAEVRPQVNGIIQARLFNEGTDVKAGDVLYQIDPSIYQATYDTAAASMARSQANLALAELSFKRSKSLLVTGAIAQEEYDRSATTLQQAAADLAQSSASLAQARVNLGFTRITAPISGRVGKSNVTVGALATAHQGPAFATIQQTDPIYVDAMQSAANLLRFRHRTAEGQLKNRGIPEAKVRLVFEDRTSYPLEGSLRFSDVTIDPSTGSFILRTVFPNPDQVLMPGMYVRLIVEEGVIENGILVPQRGVSRDTKGNATALIVDGADTVEQRVLTTDRAIGANWLVSDGLKPGDRVIVEGLQSARPGTKVKVVPFGQPEGQPARKDAERPIASAK